MPIDNITADTIAFNFYSERVFRFGVSFLITTGRGKKFESQLFQSLTKIIGTQHIHTTPYHLESNGLVKRFYISLKATIRFYAAERCVETLPIIPLGLRSCMKEDIQTSVAELAYSETLRLPNEFFSASKGYVDPATFFDRLKDHIFSISPVPTNLCTGDCSIFVHKAFSSCIHVFLRQDATHI